MIDDEDAAKAWLRTLPRVDDVAWGRLETLAAMLRQENQRQNLISAGSMDHVWQRHIADSAQLLEHVPRGTPTWLDLGTGAGFPGLVIAALCPEMRLTMVESRKRRVEWLEHACSHLGLENAVIAGNRLEEMPSDRMDIISARAFAPLEDLLKLASRFSTSETLWLLPKGRSAAQELADLSGWQHRFHVEPSLTDPEAGIVVGTLAGRKGSKS